ncbi:single-stranded DNA-binding protein [Desulfovibrio inopinatus]|uniref:single-stranded DNA-binding protein n=1 Tax=Desulfovibrio inopinatus TaxID=102109 RepID=UPI000413B3DF|nr:single-stranded DNA-binding protein [Desulfovibrio inopinatus]
MAGSLNKVMLIGRLGQDPKLQYLPSGSPVTEFSLATDESYTNRDGQKVEQTEWHRIKVFGRVAEICSNYLSKGRLVYIEGQIRTRSWDDQQGQKRYITEIVVSGPGSTVTFLESRSQAEGGYAGRAPQQGRQEYGAPPQRQQAPGQANRAPAGQTAKAPLYEDQDDMGPAFPSEASGMDDVPF